MAHLYGAGADPPGGYGDGAQYGAAQPGAVLPSFPFDACTTLQTELLEEGHAPPAITSCGFDCGEELLWCGTEDGWITAMYAPTLARHVSVEAHAHAVTQIVPLACGALSLSASSVKFHTSGGIETLTCASCDGEQNALKALAYQHPHGRMAGKVYVGRAAPVIEQYDLTRGVLIKSTELKHACEKLNWGTQRGLLVAGQENGELSFRDTRNGLRQELMATAHGLGSVTGITGKGDLVVTCGTTTRAGQVVVDQFIKVFDVRYSARLLNQIQFPSGPVSVEFNHGYESPTLSVVGYTGAVQTLDVVNPAVIPYTYQIDTHGASIIGQAVSSTGELVAFNDDSGWVHVYASGEESYVNAESFPTAPVDEYALSQQEFQLPDDLTACGLTAEEINPAKGEFKSNSSLQGARVIETKKKGLPKMYARVECNRSALTAERRYEEFDFSTYNKTRLPGLTNDLANCYVNPVLQILHFVPELRSKVLAHTCEREFCLTCEMSFLSHMLSTCPPGLATQPLNFLRTLRQIREAAALGLIEGRDELEARAEHSPIRRVQAFLRFILEQLNKEELSRRQALGDVAPTGQTACESIFGTISKETLKCTQCAVTTAKETRNFQVDLQYPTVRDGQRPSFVDLLKRSLDVSQEMRAWCEGHKAYTRMKQNRLPLSLPTVLSPGSTPGVSPLGNAGAVKTTEVSESSTFAPTKAPITANPSTPSVSRTSAPGSVNEWLLFNDFVVSQVSKDEVTQLYGQLKIPCLCMYTKVEKPAPLPLPPSPITFELYKKVTHGMSVPRGVPFVPFSCVGEDTPGPGMLLGIDAEFVSLAPAIMAVRDDGTEYESVPARLGLARVSVVRGQGQQKLTPIIDDYIRAVEPVHDYLTRFSGLVPGDLDPATSPHFITQLKHAYLKLRYLIDAGCIFVGHGLKQDFKMINIVVPPDQVIDTVELFHFKRQRKLSLKFLATNLLGEEIQGETHDSIEDARTAIKLYETYLDLQARGEFESELLEIYRFGKKFGFKGETTNEETNPSDAGLMSAESWTNLQQDMSALGMSDDGGVSLQDFAQSRQSRFGIESHQRSAPPPIAMPFTPQMAPQMAPQMTPQMAPQMTPQMAPQMAPQMTPQMTPAQLSQMLGIGFGHAQPVRTGLHMGSNPVPMQQTVPMPPGAPPMPPMQMGAGVPRPMHAPPPPPFPPGPPGRQWGT
ncbi:PAB-dependent poly(A) ribonuclease, subunit PAN2 [Ostreococcus tauri]|uniref:PAB-dependent poly(A) ribonuclease, subunit PAN2 n=1 Tax=Ostreococcus tauri TaxID=70448 RepID=A0A1Y5I058_OSTTA|nr:PAB-dependent poly(A) ribonuclease, subunit PAN2 [Ostreococcus tauri]